MSRFDEYKNEFDDDDTGEDIEVTDDDEAASDDDGREAAELLLANMVAVVGNKPWNIDERRMWLRMAKRALTEGAERRQDADARERTIKDEELQSDRARAASESAAARRRDLLARSNLESEIRWKNAETAVAEADAAWQVADAKRVPVQAHPARPSALVAANQRDVAERRIVAQPKPKYAPPTPVVAKQVPAAAPMAARPAEPRSMIRQGTASPRLPSSAVTAPAAVQRVLGPSRPVPQTPRQAFLSQPAPVVSPPRPKASPSLPMIARSQSPGPCSQPTSAPQAAVARPVTPTSAEPPSYTGADLAAYRRSTGLTQVQFAQHIGVTQGTVSKAEGNPRAILGPSLGLALRDRLAE